MQRTIGLMTSVLLAVILAGMTPASSESAEKELLVLCGTSFGPPTERLLKEFEKETGIKAVISFGGSEDLLPQVKLKTVGDVFITHDPYMEYTKEAGALIRWVQVGNVAPALVVKKGNPHKLEKIADLAKPGLKVLLPNPDFSTCGEMVFQLMEKKGIKDAVLKNVGNAMFRSHADIGNKMKLGVGDAAMMWNGVAHNFKDAIDVIRLPYEYDEEIRVGVIGLSYTKNRAEVEKFLKFIDKRGKEVFEEFGYVK
jgi:molybdate transport system substrate-binding protein